MDDWATTTCNRPQMLPAELNGATSADLVLLSVLLSSSCEIINFSSHLLVEAILSSLLSCTKVPTSC
jgi:hypothetical protein